MTLSKWLNDFGTETFPLKDRNFNRQNYVIFDNIFILRIFCRGLTE